MEKILITGINGFVGSHLAEYCLNKKCIVYGTILKGSEKNNIQDIESKITEYEGDLTDFYFVDKILKEIKPSKIFHLAGESSVGNSWNNPSKTFKNNIIPESNLFQSIKEMSDYNPWISIACSSEEYGKSENFPINEKEPLKPISPYGLSKFVQDIFAKQYFKNHNFNVIRLRAFTHIGPRQRGTFVCSSFAKQIAQIEKGLIEPIIKVGNLEPKRDFTDVRDITRAYWLSLEKGKPGDVYNLCSGYKGTYSIQEILNQLLKLSKGEIKIQEESNLMRKSDLPLSVGDNTKFVQQTGWKPEISIDKTLKDLLDYWREVL